MESLHILLMIGAFIIIVVFYYATEQDKAERNAAQKAVADKQRAIIKAKQDNEFNELLEKRESQFGKLTKEVTIQYGKREDNIFIYQDTKVIILNGIEYSFNDITSVKIEKRIQYGKETHTTKPDAGELAYQKMLYGSNRSYNVKEVTTVTKTPDTIYYDVYIYLNSLDKPCLKYDVGTNAQKANKICALIEVIVRGNSNNNTI